MSAAPERAGAVGIRSNSARDVRQIKAAVDLPVIGLIKKEYPPFEPYITVTMDEVDTLVEAGADVIALDCTSRERPDGQGFSVCSPFVHAAARVGHLLLLRCTYA